MNLKSSGTDDLYSSTVFLSGSLTISNSDQNSPKEGQALVNFYSFVMFGIFFKIVYLTKFGVDYSFPGIVFPAAGTNVQFFMRVN